MAKKKDTLEFDVSAGWAAKTLDTKKKDYDLKFVDADGNVVDANITDHVLKGNNVTLSVETDVQYYATVKVDKDTIFDGHLAKLDDNGDWADDNQSVYVNGVRSIRDSFVEATYLTAGGKRINLAKYNTLSKADQEACTLIEGTLKLTIQTGAAHKNNDSFAKYRLTTDTLYTLEDSWKTTGDYEGLTGEARAASTADVKFLLGLEDIVNINKEGGYKYAFYTEAFYNGLEADQQHTLTDLHIYKVVNNGKAVDVTAEYVADAEGKDFTAYNKGLSEETSTADIVLKNFAKAGDVAVIGKTGEGTIEDVAAYFDYEVSLNGKKSYTGTRLNEIIASTKENETFAMGTGEDEVNFSVMTGETPTLTGFGKDTVKVAAGEELNLRFTDLVAGDTITTTRKGDDVIFTATRGTGEEAKELGQVTLKNYANVGDGYVELYRGVDNITDATLLNAVYTAEDATHKGNKFTGTSFADKAESTKANETFALGKGNDEIEFVGNLGKDTVKLTAGEDLTLDFAKAADLNYAIKGNNVVLSSNVKYYATITPTDDVEWDTYTYKKDKTYTLELVQVAKSSNEAQLPSGSYTFGMVERNATKAEKAAGYGKISMFLDYTDINAGYALNSENAPIKYWKVDADGNKTEVTKAEVYGNLALTAESFAAANAGLFNSGSVTLQNYMKLADRGLVSIDGQLGTLANTLETVLKLNDDTTANPYNKSEATKGQTIKGTFLDETFTGSAYKDKITTGAGDDEVTAGKGNDTITLDKGWKELNFAKGDGSDTVVGAEKATYTNLDLADGAGVSYSKSGNNLVVTSYFEGETPVTDTVTVKNYFKGSDRPVVAVDDDVLDFVTDGVGADYLTIIAGDKAKKVTGSAFNDNIVAGKKTTVVNAGEGNNQITQAFEGQIATFNAGKGNDTYIITDLDTTIDINDKGGEDTLNVQPLIGSEDKLVALFDVKKDSAKSKKFDDFTTMSFASKDNLDADLSAAKFDGLSMSLNIKNYFGENYAAGAGKIENINYGDKIVTVDVNKIKSDVQNWLNAAPEAKGYTSAFDVFNKGDVADITALVAIYNANTTMTDPV